MKILGFQFSSDLSWSHHIKKVCETIKRDSHAIRMLSKYLNSEQLTYIARSKVLSKAWYGGPLRLSRSILKMTDIKLLNTSIGHLLRVIVKDWDQKLNRKTLHNILKIPTSIEWGNYLTIAFANNICRKTLPDDLFT